jgi:hypothetical protein
VLGLYALWRIAGRLSVMKVDHAVDRGHTIWHVEQALHLPSELALQQLALAHPLVVQAANLYYAVAHVPAVIAMLLWAFIWHRDPYARVRNVLALSTGACLAVQLVPSRTTAAPTSRAHPTCRLGMAESWSLTPVPTAP